MRIFILEDNPERNLKFRRELIGHTVDIAMNVVEAKKLLTDNKYDLMFLDHDLGGQIYTASDSESGCEVARFLKEKRIFVPTIIHSCNPVGAKNMRDELTYASCIPFIYLDIGGIVSKVGEK